MLDLAGRASPGPGMQPHWPGSLLTPVTIYGHFWAPAVPAPGPACFPQLTGRHGAGHPPPHPPRAWAHPWPCALLDARAQGQGGGRGRRFLQSPRGASLSSPWDRDQHLREKYTSTLLQPPLRRRSRWRSRLSLKGHEPPPAPAPALLALGRGHFQMAPRLGLLTCSLPAVASLHTGLGGAQRGQVTHPRSHTLGLRERPKRSCSYAPPCLDSGPHNGSWGQLQRAQGHIRSPLASSCSDSLPNQAGGSAPHHPCPQGGL